MLGIYGRMVGNESQWLSGYSQHKKSDLFIIYYNMEKLLNLLNEFKEGKSFKFTKYDEKYWMFDTNLNANGNTSLPEETITCKKFWFIQWLVGTDKIDYGAWHNVFVNSNYFDNIAGLREYEVLTMYLSIQDEPIEFLISILK